MSRLHVKNWPWLAILCGFQGATVGLVVLKLSGLIGISWLWVLMPMTFIGTLSISILFAIYMQQVFEEWRER